MPVSEMLTPLTFNVAFVHQSGSKKLALQGLNLNGLGPAGTREKATVGIRLQGRGVGWSFMLAGYG
jgi:hypothetical protein